MPNVRMRSRACLMYGLIKIGQPHERDADTGDVSLCDIGTDGFFITYGSREDIEKIAHYLTEKNIPGNTAPCRCRGSRSNHHDQGSHWQAATLMPLVLRHANVSRISGQW